MKIRYSYKILTKREKIITWLNFFEFKYHKTNSKGFDIYLSPYDYHNAIILRKKSIGFRYCELVNIITGTKRQFVRKGKSHGYIQVPTYRWVRTGMLLTKNIDFNALKTKEDLCKYIVNTNKEI